MRVKAVGALVLAVASLTLASCALGSSADGDGKITQWINEKKAVDEGGSGVVLFARVDKDQKSGGSKISTSFEKPRNVNELRFSCFGEGEMDGLLRLKYEDGGSSEVPFDDLFCRDAEESLRVPAADEGVIFVEFSVSNSTFDSAWSVTVD
ncbi:hypothetical protein [Curtobacterium sp. MCLR17_040]|uniref:hypothetical protein n=1 Tax=Curtobacterium sp. MCLR17_040 TaxID=2175625 RepID=UPI0011B417C1|nr:hypothetical protein [Curtobacterium sp. MCLR17_040]